MRVGICDDDAIWCRKAEQIIYKYADQTETELEVICFMIPEELNSYEGYPLDMLFMDIVLENNEEKKMIENNYKKEIENNIKNAHYNSQQTRYSHIAATA